MGDTQKSSTMDDKGSNRTTQIYRDPLKRTRLSNNDTDWKNITVRNQAVNMIKNAKLKFYHTCFEDNKSDS